MRAAIAESEGETYGGAGSCHQQGLSVQQIKFSRLTPTHSTKIIRKASVVFLEMKTLEIHLLMALKDICSYNLDGNFDELFRNVEIENSTDAAICV